MTPDEAVRAAAQKVLRTWDAWGNSESDMEALRAALAIPQVAAEPVAWQIDKIVQAVAELPDRDSPDDWPEVMLVTPEELHEARDEAVHQDDLRIIAVAERDAAREETRALHKGIDNEIANLVAERDALRVKIMFLEKETP